MRQTKWQTELKATKKQQVKFDVPAADRLEQVQEVEMSGGFLFFLSRFQKTQNAGRCGKGRFGGYRVRRQEVENVSRVLMFHGAGTVPPCFNSPLWQEQAHRNQRT